MSGQWYRNERGKRLDPRRRRKIARMLDTGQYGDEKKLATLFTNPNEFVSDMRLVEIVMNNHGYHIPPEAYKLVLAVPMEIAKNEDECSKVRIRAAGLIRSVIKDAKEMELINAELDVMKGENKPEEVIVREDENFFSNDAHEKSQPEG